MVQLTILLCEFIKPETKVDRGAFEALRISIDFISNNAIDEVYRDILKLLKTCELVWTITLLNTSLN